MLVVIVGLKKETAKIYVRQLGFALPKPPRQLSAHLFDSYEYHSSTETEVSSRVTRIMTVQARERPLRIPPNFDSNLFSDSTKVFFSATAEGY